MTSSCHNESLRTRESANLRPCHVATAKWPTLCTRLHFSARGSYKSALATFTFHVLVGYDHESASKVAQPSLKNTQNGNIWRILRPNLFETLVDHSDSKLSSALCDDGENAWCRDPAQRYFSEHLANTKPKQSHHHHESKPTHRLYIGMYQQQARRRRRQNNSPSSLRLLFAESQSSRHSTARCVFRSPQGAALANLPREEGQ